MKQKERSILKRMLSVLVMVVLLAMVPDTTVMQAHATGYGNIENDNVDELQATIIEWEESVTTEKNTRTMLYDCNILYSCSENGLHVEIATGSVGTASVLGIKDIAIKQKVWYGWKTIATGSGAEEADSTHITIYFDYPNVELGETYRITCVHYGTVGTYSEVENDTGAFVFTY